MSMDSPPAPAPADTRLAIIVESLYLANLLLAPALAYGIILWIRFSRRAADLPLARCHLAQAVRAGLLGVILPAVTIAFIVANGGFTSLATWVAAEVYIIFIHTPLILLGLVGLLRAMSGKPYVFPLIGARCN
jgi:hypothetical protein